MSSSSPVELDFGEGAPPEGEGDLEPVPLGASVLLASFVQTALSAGKLAAQRQMMTNAQRIFAFVRVIMLLVCDFSQYVVRNGDSWRFFARRVDERTKGRNKSR